MGPMRYRAVAVSFLCATVIVCAAADVSAQTAVAEIAVTGHIDDAMAARLHPLLASDKPHTLRLNSSGGDDAAALTIAADIRRSHAAVIVDGLCAGPCANYLFIAAARRTVQPDGLVVFTGSATSRLAMVPAQRLKEISGDYEKNTRQEKQLLNDAGANSALLLEPQLGLQTDCYSLTSKDRTGKAYINYQARAVGWTPSRAYLTRTGVKMSGFWPQTDAQFQTALQKAIPGGARGTILYSIAKAPATETALLGRLHAIRECDTGLPKK
jgi:hypothetical protein